MYGGLYMPDDFKKDTSIEDEIEKSLQKMVEEETTVAKALVGKNDEPSGSNMKAVDINDGKTRVIPQITDEILREQKNNYSAADDEQKDIMEDDDIFSEEDDDETDAPADNDNANKTEVTDKKTKKPMDKKTKLILAGVGAGVALVIIIIIIVASSLNKKSKQNYDYYYKTGMKLYEEGNYGDASSYLSKASKENEGKKNLDLKYTLYRCYESSGNEDEAVNVLKDILSYDENYEKAVKALADIYYKREDADNLTKLIRKYQDGKCKDAVKNYIVSEPVPSKESGSYDNDVELKFTCDSGCVVYYTTDGKEPDSKSTLYDGTGIKLETGTTKIKAVAVNSIGVYSNVVQLEYVIEYGAPSAPDVSPASGKYSAGEKVRINNIPDKCKAYYTTDGTTPTSSSTEYTGEFDMPAGNTVIAFVIINEHEQSSTVVKRNYNVEVKNTYTYSQAESQLKSVLISRKVLKSDSVAADGSGVNFVYISRTKVGDNEMYIIRYDVIKSGSTSTAGLYGVDTSSGKVYTVTGSEGSYSANEY